MEKFRRLLLPRLAQVGLRKAIAQSTVQHCCSDKLPTGRTLRFILASSLSLSIYFSSCNNRVSDSAAERSAGISTQTDVADTSLGIDVLAQKDDTASLKLHKEILVRAAKSANF